MIATVFERIGLGHGGTTLTLAAVLAGMFGIQPLATAASFLVTGALANPRAYHTATLLANGKVLVAGGSDDTHSLSSAELYDPVTGEWTLTGAMNDARDAHAAALLANGKVLVTGGFGGPTLSSAELYDPATGAWTLTGAMNTDRDSHTATLLPNGMVLVAGGEDASDHALSSAELYDPVAGTWTATGSMSSGRLSHTATLLADGRVLVTGGDVLGGVSAEIYDPASGTWVDADDMHASRWNHTATLLPNGRVLVAGGVRPAGFGLISTDSAEIYDPITDTFTPTGPMLSYVPYAAGRGHHTATLLPSGKVLVAGGGYADQSREVVDISNANLYDPATGTWAAAASLNTARDSHTATLLPNGNVLLTGGYAYTGDYFSSTERYGVPPATALLTRTSRLANGSFQFGFSNAPGALLSVISTTNVALPSSNWTVLGAATEISPGQFQFTDTQTTNYPHRFYSLRSP